MASSARLAPCNLQPSEPGARQGLDPSLPLAELARRVATRPITETAQVEKLDKGYTGRLLHLTLLAPGLIEVVLNGSPCPAIGLHRLMKAVPAVWREQAVEPGEQSCAERPARHSSTTE